MQGLNLLLCKWFNSFLEYGKAKPINEINSLHYDKGNNKIILDVQGGYWVISETEDMEVGGVFYEE